MPTKLKLTENQIEVLQLLAKRPHPTSTSTSLGYVDGVVVAALERRGLASRHVKTDYMREARITRDGAALLVRAREKAVLTVDRRLGHTIEFSSDPANHAHEYDEEERAVLRRGDA